MKKFLIILLFIFTLSIFSFVDFSHNNQTNPPALADSGFDADYGDYDSGSSWDDDYDYGGGSYWDDDDDYDYDYGYSSNKNHSNKGSSSGIVNPTARALAIVFSIAISISPIIVFICINLKHRIRRNNFRKPKSNPNEILISQYGLRPGDGCDVELIQYAYKSYVEIQKAWMARDLSPVKNILTDEIYNMYQMQIETLIEDNQINVMSDFKLVCGRINSIIKLNNVETVRILLCVKCKDYIKLAHNNKVINGSKRATLTYIYELTFVRDVYREKTTNCPACGALIKKQMSATCPYCNSSLLLTSPNLTMSNKKMLYQFRKK